MLKYSGAILVEVLEGSSNPGTKNQAFFQDERNTFPGFKSFDEEWGTPETKRSMEEVVVFCDPAKGRDRRKLLSFHGIAPDNPFSPSLFSSSVIVLLIRSTKMDVSWHAETGW